MGQIAKRSNIVNVSNGIPCTITTDIAHEYANKSFVRITDLNGLMPIPRGMDEINNKKFRIIVLDDTSFYLQDPITFIAIDSTNYPSYISGGYCNLVQTEFIYYNTNTD